MRVVTYKKIREFVAIHPDAEAALNDWFCTTESCKWGNFNETKKTFGSVDYVGNNRYVFNIKGNTYRLVAIIIFASQKVYIRFIGTHAQYNKVDCATI